MDRNSNVVVIGSEIPAEEIFPTEKSSFLVPTSVLITDKCEKSEENEKKLIWKNNCCDEAEELDTEAKDVQGPLQKNAQAKTFCRRYAGILFALLSAIAFSLGSVSVKYLKGYHPFILGVFRFQGILLPSLPIIAYAECSQKKNVFEPLWPLTNKTNVKNFVGLALRGLLGCSALVFHFYSLKHLTIADAMIIGSCKPVLVTLTAWLILHETCGVFPIFTAFLAIFGIGIIMRPPLLTGLEAFDYDLLMGTAYGLCGVISSTFSMTVVRYLRKIHFSIVTFSFGVTGTLVCLILACAFGVFVLPDNSTDILLALSLAASAFFIQMTITLALQLEQAGAVSLVRTSETVFAFLWQYVFLGVEPDIYSLVGGCIVILAVVLTAWRKYISTLPIGDPKRNLYSFVLK